MPRVVPVDPAESDSSGTRTGRRAKTRLPVGAELGSSIHTTWSVVAETDGSRELHADTMGGGGGTRSLLHGFQREMPSQTLFFGQRLREVTIGLAREPSPSPIMAQGKASTSTTNWREAANTLTRGTQRTVQWRRLLRDRADECRTHAVVQALQSGRGVRLSIEERGRCRES